MDKREFFNDYDFKSIELQDNSPLQIKSIVKKPSSISLQGENNCGWGEKVNVCHPGGAAPC